MKVKGYDAIGTIRFVGDHHQDKNPRVGVELDKPIGKNSGTIGGHQYFNCAEKCGVLTDPRNIKLLKHQ